MKYLIWGLILSISPFFAFGHNPLSARFHLEAGENASLLNINLSQDGVNQALLEMYGAEQINQMDTKQFKELIVDYIKNNFHLVVDKENVPLKKGGIKLGSHQTDLKFVLPPFPKETTQIYLHIPAFQENENHQTIFSYSFYGNNNKVILSSNNKYESTIALGSPTLSNKWLFFGFLTLLGSGFTAFFIARSMR